MVEKFFSRLTAEKIQCSIFLCVHNVEAQVSQAIPNLMVEMQRGPQREKSYKFKIKPDKPLFDLNSTFRRESNFYRAKEGGFQKKILNINVGQEK